MKKILTLLFIGIISVTAIAQTSCTPFETGGTTNIKKWTYEGKAVKKMSGKELKTIISCDPEAYKKYKTGGALVITGSFLIGLGGGLTLFNPAAAIVVIVASMPFLFGGIATSNKSFKIYNYNAGGTTSSIGELQLQFWTHGDSKSQPGIGLRFSF